MIEGIRRKLKIIFSVSRKRAEEEIKERLIDLGIPEDMAEESSKKIAENKSAINSLIPEEESNERRAAIYTGIAYIIGVFFPLIPYFSCTHNIHRFAIFHNSSWSYSSRGVNHNFDHVRYFCR